MSDVEIITNQAVQESTLSIFLKALTEKHTGDNREPGLTIAWLPEKDQFYAAVNRFPSASGHVRICSAYHETLEGAVKNCMKVWRRKAGIDVEDNLKKFAEVIL